MQQQQPQPQAQYQQQYPPPQAPGYMYHHQMGFPVPMVHYPQGMISQPHPIPHQYFHQPYPLPLGMPGMQHQMFPQSSHQSRPYPPSIHMQPAPVFPQVEQSSFVSQPDSLLDISAIQPAAGYPRPADQPPASNLALQSNFEEKQLEEAIQASMNLDKEVSFALSKQPQPKREDKQAENRNRPEQIKNKADQNLRGFKDNIEHFLKEGRGWFPKILPKRILEHISEVRPGPRKGPPYAQATKGSLRVMCYNVLAPSLVSAVEYHGVDQDHIEWKNRLEMIKREIQWCAPHILCLQEVEESSELHEALTNYGFDGRHYKKPEKARNDGPATFFDKSRFILLKTFRVPFNYKVSSQQNQAGKKASYNGIYEKGNCVLITALQPIGKLEQVYLVANTHLNFNSGRGDIKLAELKVLTDALSQLKEQYSQRAKVAVIVCGDFNSTSRSGVYEYMRTGKFDCLKLDRYQISGQHFATYDNHQTPSSFSLHNACVNLDAVPVHPKNLEDKKLNDLCRMYTELMNTHPVLELNENLEPQALLLKPALPQDQIDLESLKYKNIVLNQCELHVQKRGENSIEQLLNMPDRPFLILPNRCGRFKSAYAEVNLNHILLLNTIKNTQKVGSPIFDPEYLDNYMDSKQPGLILSEALTDKAYHREVLGQELNGDDQYYGSYQRYHESKNIKDWLKFQACLTKEPSYTSYTNIKGTVDYIFYESGGLFEVVRTLNTPSYSRFFKGNLHNIPHLLMPSDHLSLLAEFFLMEDD